MLITYCLLRLFRPKVSGNVHVVRLQDLGQSSFDKVTPTPIQQSR